jgi:hypothetical protein
MTYNEFQECERCMGDAQTLLEHATFAEAVCFACRDDESRHEEAKAIQERAASATVWIYENMREEKD